MTVRAANEIMKRMMEWAAKNDYVQCAGCLGYSSGLGMDWVKIETRTYFPFCTDECYDKYMKLPLSE